MPTDHTAHPRALGAALPAILSLGLAMTVAVGCGGQIKPDGPKRVVFTQPDGTKRVIEVAPATELRAAAIETLMRMTSDPAPELRANAIEALSPVTDQVEPVVALALTDPNPGVRSVAAMVAGKSMLSSLAPTIRGMISDPSPYVRASALFALGRFGEDVDLTELSTMLLENSDPKVRSQVAFILGELREPTAVPMLQQAAIQPAGDAQSIEKKLYRLQIAEALFKLGYAQSIDTIRAALYPSRPDELEATVLAVQIIGEIKDTESIDQLIYLADAESDLPMPPEVRLAVASSLAQMGHREGFFIANEYLASAIATIRSQSATVLGQTNGRDNLGKLEVMMVNDPSPLTQVAAAAGIVDYTQRQLASNGSK